jgi:hypothetical protein
MKNPTKMAILIAAVFSVLPLGARANMSYSPWVHEIVQNGADLEVTVSIFDETSWTNDDGEPLPGLEASYTLQRWSVGDSLSVFEDRVFNPEEADEITEYMCHSWYGDYYESTCNETDDCVDCDGDEIGDCPGFCGVAYRYKVIDVCPPVQEDLLYWMFTDPPYDLSADGEGLGFTTAAAEDVGDECQETAGDTDIDADSDTDSDADTDTDADSNVDSDADTDTDSDTEDTDDGDGTDGTDDSAEGCSVGRVSRQTAASSFFARAVELVFGAILDF